MKKYKEPADYWVIGLVIFIAMLLGFGTSCKVNGSEADTQISQEYIAYCEEIGEEYGICPELLEAVIETESGGNPDAVGRDGDSGLMQIIPRWHRDRMDRLHVGDIFNPYGNIRVGTDYISELAGKYGDVSVVLMIYNGVDPDAAVELAESNHMTEYAAKILSRAAQLEKAHGK